MYCYFIYYDDNTNVGMRINSVETCRVTMLAPLAVSPHSGSCLIKSVLPPAPRRNTRCSHLLNFIAGTDLLRRLFLLETSEL